MTTLRVPRHKQAAAEVRAVLSRVGLRQKDLAQFLEISAASASELWNGKVPYTLDRLDAIAEWLGVDIADLLGSSARTGPESGLAVSSG